MISKVDDTSSDDDTLCVLCGEEEQMIGMKVRFVMVVRGVSTSSDL